MCEKEFDINDLVYKADEENAIVQAGATPVDSTKQDEKELFDLTKKFLKKNFHTGCDLVGAYISGQAKEKDSKNQVNIATAHKTVEEAGKIAAEKDNIDAESVNKRLECVDKKIDLIDKVKNEDDPLFQLVKLKVVTGEYPEILEAFNSAQEYLQKLSYKNNLSLQILDKDLLEASYEEPVGSE